jgi:SAM-dependent methyltransferase
MGMKSSYYDQSVALGASFQADNKSWAGLDVVKYQKQIQDLVIKYNAKTILDYGCGKGAQYTEKLPYDDVSLKTFDEWLGVTVYKYDPCVPEFATPPPAGTKFDGVICSQVLQTIPDADLPWVAEQLSGYADRFCFISLNFQRPAKAKKMIYDTEYFKLPRTREFFKSFFNNWSGSDLYWWWKDRAHYDQWVDDQLAGSWKDIPDIWVGKYSYIEKIY